MKWKYLIKVFSSSYPKEQLNKLEEEGWELICVTCTSLNDYRYFFKRLKE